MLNKAKILLQMISKQYIDFQSHSIYALSTQDNNLALNRCRDALKHIYSIAVKHYHYKIHTKQSHMSKFQLKWFKIKVHRQKIDTKQNQQSGDKVSIFSEDYYGDLDLKTIRKSELLAGLAATGESRQTTAPKHLKPRPPKEA